MQKKPHLTIRATIVAPIQRDTSVEELFYKNYKYFKSDQEKALMEVMLLTQDEWQLSCAILTASMQQLIKRNWKNLTFSYSADDPPREESS
jgi:hypothetical protein